MSEIEAESRSYKLIAAVGNGQVTEPLERRLRLPGFNKRRVQSPRLRLYWVNVLLHLEGHVCLFGGSGTAKQLSVIDSRKRHSS